MKIKLNQIKEKDYESTPYSYIGNCHDGLTLVGIATNEDVYYTVPTGIYSFEGYTSYGKPIYYEYTNTHKTKKVNFGYVDRAGEEIIPCIYIRASAFSEGLAVVGDKKGNFLIYNTEGKIVTNLGTKYKRVGRFHNGLALVEYDYYQKNFINSNGEELLANSISDATDFSEGYSIVGFSDRHIMDTKGEFHDELLNNVKKIYPDCLNYYINGPFHNGILPVSLKYHGKKIIVYIDKNGNCQNQNDFTLPLKYGNGKSNLIEEQLNKEVLNKFYSDITYFGKKITLCADTKEELIKKKKEFYESLKNSLANYNNELDSKINELTLTK